MLAADWFVQQVEDFEHASKTKGKDWRWSGNDYWYSKFYINLLQYDKFIDVKLLRLYHSRVLRETIHEDCKGEKVSKHCPYKYIATAYFHINQFQKSIPFLENALKVENGLTDSELVTISAYLVQSYEYTGDDEKAMDAFQRTVLQIYEKVIQFPSTLTIHDHRMYVRMLRRYGETQKAVELERKEIKELLETDALGGITDSSRPYELAFQMYGQGNYTDAIAMATLALSIIEQNRFYEDINGRLKLRVLTGKAQYRIGNTSEAFVYFKAVADWIMQNETSGMNIYEKEYSDCCWYLMFHMKYMNECYLQKIDSFGTFIVAAGVASVYYLLVPPLDLHVSEEQEHLMNPFEQLTRLSQNKDILLHKERDEKDDFELSTVFHYVNSESTDGDPKPKSHLIFTFLNFIFNFALQFVIIRALLNVVLITLKLTAFVATLLCVYSCLNCCGCGCCFCCCRRLSAFVTILVYCFSILYTYLAITYFD